MKITLTKPVDYVVSYVICDMGPRYWEDATVNGKEEDNDNPKMPLVDGDRWKLKIDVETGIIDNWTQGVTANVFYKVCDDGLYTLLDSDEAPLIKADSYVPQFLGGGDYVEIEIDKDGQIVDWDPSLVAEFFEEYEQGF